MQNYLYQFKLIVASTEHSVVEFMFLPLHEHWTFTHLFACYLSPPILIGKSEMDNFSGTWLHDIRNKIKE